MISRLKNVDRFDASSPVAFEAPPWLQQTAIVPQALVPERWNVAAAFQCWAALSGVCAAVVDSAVGSLRAAQAVRRLRN